MVFQQQQPCWMLSFCFVSGHDFSRAVKEEKRSGLHRLRKNPVFSDLRCSEVDFFGYFALIQASVYVSFALQAPFSPL